VLATVALAVTTPAALMPKLTLLEFENVNALDSADVVPALIRMLACVLATVALAVTTPAASMPKLTLLLLLNVNAELSALVVPAEIRIDA
jgi:hypothetical protein